MSSLDRDENLERLRAGGTWDVVVIGGGATGLGAAVDAAARGYRTLLLEAHDFAQGTSSRSTKLIHGGVRYLAQGDIPLVREALHERGVLLPQCAAPGPSPRLRGARPIAGGSCPIYGIGLKVYDLLAGRLNLGGSRWIGPAEVVAADPDDSSAAGCAAGSSTPTASSTTPGWRSPWRGRWPTWAAPRSTTRPSRTSRSATAGSPGSSPATTRPARSSRSRPGRSINATGVFVDAVRRLDDPGTAGSPLLTPSQGAHLVLDRSFLPGDSALLVPHTDDGRVLFAIPWHDRVLVGTTDTPVAELSDRAAPAPGGDRLPARPRRPLPGRRSRAADDVLSTFAGLRPLLRGQTARGRHRPDRQALARACRRRLRLGTGHDHRREVDDLSPDGRSTPSTTRARSAACPTGRRRPPRSSCTAGRIGRRTRRSALGLRVGRGRDPRTRRRAPRVGPAAASRATLSRGRGGLGRSARGGPLGRGRAGAPDPRALPRRPGQHRGRSRSSPRSWPRSSARTRPGRRRRSTRFRELAEGYLAPDGLP